MQLCNVEKLNRKNIEGFIDVLRRHYQRGGNPLSAVFFAQRRQKRQKFQVHFVQDDHRVDVGGLGIEILG